MFSRTQAHAAGLTDELIEANLRARRWQRVFRGVYAGFTGPLPRSSWLAAVLLWAGPGAVLSHDTAAELVGLSRDVSNVVHVTVPTGRRRQPVAGVVVRTTPGPWMTRSVGSRWPVRVGCPPRPGS